MNNLYLLYITTMTPPQGHLLKLIKINKKPDKFKFRKLFLGNKLKNKC